MAGKPGEVDFESPEFDDLDVQREDAIVDALDTIYARFSDYIRYLGQRNQCKKDAIEHSIEACLSTIDILYVPRDDHAVSAISLKNNSWEPEAVPVPCTVDAWVRGVIPEVEKPPAPAIETARSKTGVKEGTMARTSRPGPSSVVSSEPEPLTTVTNRKGRSAHPTDNGRASASPTRKKKLTPEQQLAEDRLREELVIRRRQEEVARLMEQKDEEARIKLANIQRELKGKEYGYNHKGEIVVLNGFNPDGVNVTSEAEYRVATPLPPGSEAPPDGKTAAGANKSPDKKQKAAKVQKERKLQSDFREAPTKTQPSAMDTMRLVPGVTLRAGAAAKAGPPRKIGTAHMTRDEYQKNAQGQLKLQQKFGALGTAAKPTKPSEKGEGTDNAKDPQKLLTSPPVPMDANLAFVSTPEWGSSPPSRGYDAPESLTSPQKASSKQIQEELGRTHHIPRVRPGSNQANRTAVS